MLFNSAQYLLFLPIVVAVHFLLPRGWRWAWMLGASYYFYMSWEPAYALLLLWTTLVDYGVARLLVRTEPPHLRRALLMTSLSLNLGVLFTFKYYGFFRDTLRALAAAAGLDAPLPAPEWLLPVGISFYTFQSIAYTVDVYRRGVMPEMHIGRFALYVCFFPQLVAGPIERAAHLLPQLRAMRTFDPALARTGLRLILWGLFKKVVVADTCAPLATAAFADPAAYSGAGLALGMACFALQIYGDFSGYSDIAVGTSRLFGIQLMANFRTPYFARNIAEFWRRWHISLTTWFRDYLYVPLGGSRGSRVRTAANTAAVFLVSGLWHGANWTFVAWGAFHAALFLPLLVRGTNRRFASGVVAENRLLPSPAEAAQMASTFAWVCIGWVFFRADSLGAAGDYLARLVAFPEGALPGTVTPTLLRSVAVLGVVDWACRSGEPPRWWTARQATPLRWAVYMWAAAQVWFNFHSPQGFIYFQF